MPIRPAACSPTHLPVRPSRPPLVSRPDPRIRSLGAWSFLTFIGGCMISVAQTRRHTGMMKWDAVLPLRNHSSLLNSRDVFYDAFLYRFTDSRTHRTPTTSPHRQHRRQRHVIEAITPLTRPPASRDATPPMRTPPCPGRSTDSAPIAKHWAAGQATRQRVGDLTGAEASGQPSGQRMGD